MKISFLMHTVYGAGGGVLTVVKNLAQDLAQRHEVEIVSVTRSLDEAVHALPPDVPVRTLVDMRGTGGIKGRETATDPDLRAPSELLPRREPHYRAYSRRSDNALRQYFADRTDGAAIGMQPGMALAVAQLAAPSLVRVGQDHRPFETRRGDLLDAYAKHLPDLDMFLTLTGPDADKFSNLLGDRPPIRVMPNATPAYDGEHSTLLNPIVTAAGHLSRDKGFDRLVEAWAQVATRHPDWVLRIFGQGPQKQALQAQIDQLGLAGSVRLMGYSTRLREELAESSLFVLSSRVEGYGMVLVEAMSCGVPVVSFDAPSGPASIITEGHDGFLVPNGDIGGMARRIGEVIAMGTPGRRALAVNAVETARSRTQPAISARWEDLLDELDAAKHVRR